LTATAEGLDACHALSHYSRILFMMQLLPLLSKSLLGRIVTVFAGGMESSNIKLDDLNLEKPGNFSPIQSQRQMASMLSLCMERLAESHANVTFIHAYPGAINTGNLTRGWGDRTVMRTVTAAVSTPLIGLFGYSLKEAGERTLYLLTSAKYGGRGLPIGSTEKPGLTSRGGPAGGLFLVNHKCETTANKAVVYLRAEAMGVVWSATMKKLDEHK
jgi:hypothetical protein